MVRNGLSFDVEDWFHVYNYEGVISRDEWDACESRVVGNTRRILDILKLHSVEATFFFLGWVAQRAPELVRMVLDDGHEVATHGYAHRRLTDLDRDAFRADLLRSIEVLVRAGADEISGFRAPSFSMVRSTEWALDILADVGLRYDSSVFPTGVHPDYGIPDAPLAPYHVREGLWEIPLSVLELAGQRFPIGGGGYFRLMPYSLSRWAMRRVNRQGRAVIVYLHPWEIDPNQPHVRTAPWRLARQRINLDRTADRLVRLLQDFSFVPLRELIDA